MSTSRSATGSIISGCVFIVIGFTQIVTSQPLVFPLICFVAAAVAIFRGISRLSS